MPFTPSHAALVLPLVRINPRYLSSTGLIIGSMVPDFEYFFRMSPSGKFGHTLPGLLLFDLPVSVILAFVFHLVVKHRFISHLPVFLQTRLQPLRQLDFAAYFKTHWLIFIASALVGAASHIFWDEFTHADGYFVAHLSFYHQRYVLFEGVRYPFWYVLQNVCSYVGLAVVIIYILCLKPRAGGEVHTPALWYWGFVMLVALLVVGVRFEFDPAVARLGEFIVVSISGLCIAVVVAGVMPFRAASGYS